MCHISELDTGYVENVEKVVKVGDVIKVKVVNVDENGRSAPQGPHGRTGGRQGRLTRAGTTACKSPNHGQWQQGPMGPCCFHEDLQKRGLVEKMRRPGSVLR